VPSLYSTGAVRLRPALGALENVELNPLESDRFVWCWTTNGEYFVSSTYHSFFSGMSSMRGPKKTGEPQFLQR
jgi:hypothetical protein